MNAALLLLIFELYMVLLEYVDEIAFPIHAGTDYHKRVVRVCVLYSFVWPWLLLF